MKTMLLLCALIIGSVSSAWGAVTTITWNINGVTTTAAGGNDVNTTLKTSDVSGGYGTWTAVASKSYAGSSSGAQLGSGNYTFSGNISLSESSIPSTATIESIGITLSSSGTAYKIDAKVGSNTFGSQVSVNQKDSKTYTFTGNEIGNDIVLTFSNGGKKNVIIKAISVTYAELTASDFSLTTSSPLAIGLPAATTGTINYTTSSTGAITWNSSDETVATVVDNGNGTATVTAHQEGSTTISAIQAEDATYAASTEQSITVNVTDSRTTTVTTIVTTGITNTDLKNGTSAGLLSANVTNTGNSVAGAVVTWNSSDPSVATINPSTGEVTLVNAGSTTITASYAGNSTYAPSHDTYLLTVVDSRQELEITANFNYTFFGLSPTGSAVYAQPDVTETTVTFKNVEFKTEKNDGTKVRYDADHMRLYNKNTLTITAPDGYVITNITMVSTGGDWNTGMSANVGTYNDELDTDNKAYWSGISNSVAFTPAGTHRIASAVITLAPYATISLNADCNDGEGNIYGTYSNSSAFIVPADLTVSAISVEGNKLTVTNYKEGDIVKANTGVMVSSTTAGDHTIILSYETGTEIAGNMLKASGDAGKSAVEMNEANTSFYRLTMHNDETIGFYWGAADGAAFAIAANKAYLAVPDGAGARIAGFNLFEEEGEATAIEGVKTIDTDAPVFNLNGQRVNGNAKGLLIKNGKKFMNR